MLSILPRKQISKGGHGTELGEEENQIQGDTLVNWPQLHNTPLSRSRGTPAGRPFGVSAPPDVWSEVGRERHLFSRSFLSRNITRSSIGYQLPWMSLSLIWPFLAALRKSEPPARVHPTTGHALASPVHWGQHSVVRDLYNHCGTDGWGFAGLRLCLHGSVYSIIMY